MAKIFITGSADGLGQLAAKKLVEQGHEVVLHARNKQRAEEALQNVKGAKISLAADLSSMNEVKNLASEANKLGTFDAVIHNAGLYQVSDRTMSVDGFPVLLTVNTFAPYILTCLMLRPQRLVYLISGMHRQGDASLKGLMTENPKINYSDSKFHDLLLAKAVARYWPGTRSNAVDPGWVPTKMGGAGAPDDLEKGYETQVWLAAGTENNSLVSGHYFHHTKDDHYLKEADDEEVQDLFLNLCKQKTGVEFPKNPPG